MRMSGWSDSGFLGNPFVRFVSSLKCIFQMYSYNMNDNSPETVTFSVGTSKVKVVASLTSGNAQDAGEAPFLQAYKLPLTSAETTEGLGTVTCSTTHRYSIPAYNQYQDNEVRNFVMTD